MVGLRPSRDLVPSLFRPAGWAGYWDRIITADQTGMILAMPPAPYQNHRLAVIQKVPSEQAASLDLG